MFLPCKYGPGTRVQGPYGPGTKPGTQKGRGPGPGTGPAPFLDPRLGPWPLGSLAHMVPGPWAPSPYLQSRNMTFGRFNKIGYTENNVGYAKMMSATQQICRYAKNLSATRKICTSPSHHHPECVLEWCKGCRQLPRPPPIILDRFVKDWGI